MTSPIIWQESSNNHQLKQTLCGWNHKPKVFWCTGLSGSGKSTIAALLQKHLLEQKHYAYVLDGDNMRHGLCKDLSFSDYDRSENIRRAAHVAKLFTEAGLSVICAFISPFTKDRQMARQIINVNFYEIYLNCSLAVCELRDPKGLYKKARMGEIKGFSGIDSIYEPPQAPELIINTESQSVQESVQTILNVITN